MLLLIYRKVEYKIGMASHYLSNQRAEYRRVFLPPFGLFFQLTELPLLQQRHEAH
jgi:hypothetical protein